MPWTDGLSSGSAQVRSAGLSNFLIFWDFIFQNIVRWSWMNMCGINFNSVRVHACIWHVPTYVYGIISSRVMSEPLYCDILYCNDFGSSDLVDECRIQACLHRQTRGHAEVTRPCFHSVIQLTHIIMTRFGRSCIFHPKYSKKKSVLENKRDFCK